MDAPTPANDPSPDIGHPSILLFSVLVIATCGLVYELVSATMASYLLGDSVTQFSLVIGVYLSSMGLGSWLSKFVVSRIADTFVHTQLGIALVGGHCALALFFGFAHMQSVQPLLYALLITIGTLVGLEIPLIMRLMPDRAEFKDVVARVLAFDYIGCLLASISFPLLLLPNLGLIRTSMLFGMFNAAVALYASYVFAPALTRPAVHKAQCVVVLAILGGGMFYGEELERASERELYRAPVIFSQKSPYQQLTVTRWEDDVRLYIGGHLQFSSHDEYRYHESLVHPAMARVATPKRVLILGGGDGFAAREVLRHPTVEHIDLVDLDPLITDLFAHHAVLSTLNDHALADPRVKVHNQDAMTWLESAGSRPAYDVVLIDLPDPNNYSLGKLYTTSFYKLVRGVLNEGGSGAVQATSPELARRAYWCIVTTLDKAELHPHPYHAYVPSFGDWGFVLISKRAGDPPDRLPPNLETRFLTDDILPTLFKFPHDRSLGNLRVEPNRLNSQQLVHYYEQDVSEIVAIPRS